MDYIHINAQTKNKLIDEIFSKLGKNGVDIFVKQEESFYSFVKSRCNALINNRNTIIIINIEAPKIGINRQISSGIDLIKFFRLLNFHNPILAYSETTPHKSYYIEPKKKGDLKNIILLSPRVYFSFLNKINSKFLNTLNPISDFIELNMLKSYFRIDYHLPQEDRHRWANHWGIYSLFKVLCFLDETPKRTFESFLSNLGISEFNSIKKTFGSLPFLVWQYIYNKKRIFKNKVSSSIVSRVIQERERFRKLKKTKILYIDDKINEGWSLLFKELFYAPNHRQKLITTQPNNKETNRQFCNRVLTIIKEKEINCILLDLRLRDEDSKEKITTLLGYQTLQKIHARYSYLPVIITSATNKSRGLTKLFEAGCTGLWTKEGLDENLNDNQRLDSIANLFEMVNNSIEKLKTNYDKLIVETEHSIKNLEKKLKRVIFDKAKLLLIQNTKPLTEIFDKKIIYIDTSALIKEETLISFSTSFHLLVFLVKEMKTLQISSPEVRIIDDVFLELSIHSIKVGRRIHPELMKLSQSVITRLWKYKGLDLIKHRYKFKNEPTKSKPHADDDFFYLISKHIEANETILFVGNDIKFEKKLNSNFSNHKNSNCLTILKSKDFIKRLDSLF